MLGVDVQRGLNLLVFNLKTDADDDVLGFTTDWINQLAAQCERVFVITMTAGRLAVADNVLVMSAGRELGYSEARRAVRFYRLLGGLLKRERIDACFAHMMPLFAVMAWPMLAIRKVPVVLWYAHGSVSPTLRLATRVVDRIVTSSPTGFALLTPKLRIIGQGIDTRRFRPASRVEESGTFSLLTVGRISAIKNLHILVAAVGLLQQSHPEVPLRVRIVGSPLTQADRRYAEFLSAEIERHGVADCVTVSAGRAFHEIHREYRAADCFVNSSDTDSVDKTVLEAMSCEVPVVTSNAAFTYVLGPRLSEWVIPKGDPWALHDRLAALLQMGRNERAALGRALRQIVVRDHSLPALSARIVEQIMEVV